MRESLDLIFARRGRHLGFRGVCLGIIAIALGPGIPWAGWTMFFGFHEPQGMWFVISAIFFGLSVLVGLLFSSVGGFALWLGIRDIREANKEINLLLATDT